MKNQIKKLREIEETFGEFEQYILTAVSKDGREAYRDALLSFDAILSQMEAGGHMNRREADRRKAVMPGYCRTWHQHRRVLGSERRRINRAGVDLIKRERERQIRKGWDPDHDSCHHCGGLAVVAAKLAVISTDATVDDPADRGDWGITERWEKKEPDRGRRSVALLSMAGALIAAEIDRIQSQMEAEQPEAEGT